MQNPIILSLIDAPMAVSIIKYRNIRIEVIVIKSTCILYYRSIFLMKIYYWIPNNSLWCITSNAPNVSTNTPNIISAACVPPEPPLPKPIQTNVGIIHTAANNTYITTLAITWRTADTVRSWCKLSFNTTVAAAALFATFVAAFVATCTASFVAIFTASVVLSSAPIYTCN